MSRRADSVAALMLAVALVAVPACSRDSGPASVSLEVGHHRVRLVPLKGWEHLDHGRQQLFRIGDATISLVDLGPATPEGLVRELREAETLWRAGRRRDGFARVRELGGSFLRYASSEQRLEFWTPWTNATYVPERADSFAIEAAFDAMIEVSRRMPKITNANLIENALRRSTDMQRKEIAGQERVTIHDVEWTKVETWDRLSHLYRSRLAFVDNEGYLLVLSTDRGLIGQSGSAFDSLLSTIELIRDTPPPR